MPNQHTKAREAAQTGYAIPRKLVAPKPPSPPGVVSAAPAKPKRKRPTKAEIAAKPVAVQTAIVLNSHKDKITELETQLKALEAHVITLTATSINAAKNTSSAPRWYRPWMGGVLLGVLAAILVASLVRSCNKAPALDARQWTPAVPEITNQVDYDKLPKGAQFAYNGVTYTKGVYATAADTTTVTTSAPVKSRKSKLGRTAPGQPADAGAPTPDAPAPQPTADATPAATVQ